MNRKDSAAWHSRSASISHKPYFLQIDSEDKAYLSSFFLAVQPAYQLLPLIRYYAEGQPRAGRIRRPASKKVTTVKFHPIASPGYVAQTAQATRQPGENCQPVKMFPGDLV